MAKLKKPETKFAQSTKYGKLLAGHDTPLGIAAVNAAIAACRSGKMHPPERHKSWSKSPTTRH